MVSHWDEEIYYTEYDVVVSKNNLWICKETNKGCIPEENLKYWKFIGNYVEVETNEILESAKLISIPLWDDSVSYEKGDLVQYQDRIYQAIKNCRNSLFCSYNWMLIGYYD